MKLSRLLQSLMLAALPFAGYSQEYPFKNPELSSEERAADLCSRLTLEEKVGLMMNGSKAVDRLGVPAFEWWSEALHGVGRNGLSTVFPSCIGMAASFNDDLLSEVFTAVSDEARAKNTDERSRGVVGKYKGLSFWTPTVNIFRDPRWGRGQESYGEDPYQNGRMGLRVVRALQGDSTGRYRKLLACAKHFAVHSGPEKTRHIFDIESLPQRDLWETYLPAFKVLVKDGNVRQVMCAYQRLEGQACCGSDRLLQFILRDEWGYDGIVVSDCGAIRDFYLPNRHGVAKDEESASALGVRSGTDVECGAIYKSLPDAVKRGDITEAEIDKSVKRLLKERFDLGDFDPDSLVAWTEIPMSVVASKSHRDLALQMAREQTVLLKNNGILPLSEADAKKIMVMGPNAADSTMQWGIYYGQPGHTVTMLEGLETRVGKLPYRKGSSITALTERESVFDRMEGGMTAHYWNNTQMAGEPVTEVVYTSPIQLDNGGNTVFAPGVELTDFTTRIKGSFVAENDETLDIIFNNDDGMRIIVNGDTIHNRWKSDPLGFRQLPLAVKKGERYNVEVNYMQLADDATLNFDIARNRPVTIDEIVKSAADAEIILYFGGISPSLEREEAKVTDPGFDNGDRTSIELPAVQREILAALHEAGKKIVLVNCSGSAVALAPENEIVDAIIEAWYPGEQGGHAIADILFGDYNPSGKLPVTFYASDNDLPPFDEYRMAGRTYRYFDGKPVYPFGHGLSYTTFEFSEPRYADGVVSVDVENTGGREGAEVVQLYLKRVEDAAGPRKTLRGYEKVNLQPGEKRTVKIAMPAENWETWDETAGAMRVVGGEYELMTGPSSDDAKLRSIRVKL